MIGAALVFAILVFTVCFGQLQVFRAAACLLCTACFISGLRVRWAALPLALVAIWGFAQLALGSTVWRFGTWESALQWVALLALFVAASQFGELRRQLRVAVWFGGAFSVFAMARFYTWRGPDEAMLGAFFNHNHYAAFMELLFPLALWRVFRDRDKAVAGLCAAAMLGSAVAGGSRAGAVLLMLELLYVGLRVSRKPMLVAGGSLLVAALAVGAMWPRIEKLATPEPYDSRSETARASLQMARDRPLLGYGLGTWELVYPDYASRDTGFRLIHADDDWLEWAAEGGLPFVLAMLGVAGFAVVAAWKEPWCAGCVAVLLHALVEFPMQKLSLWAWFVVLLAIAYGPLKASVVERSH